MFTGLIEEVGKVVSTVRRGSMMDITIEAHVILDDMKLGDSVSISGACQTVTGFDTSTFTVQAVEETLRRSTLGDLANGEAVNLERSLRLMDRLGGHLVQGHVDGTGKITRIGGTGENKLISIAQPPELSRYIVEKGSIAVDGVSLTVTYARAAEFRVSVIPHTLGATTLSRARVGDRVNLETDIIAKYVEKLLGPKDPLSMHHLEELGF
ncbi:MAG: riboflavin synthase [Candidatus Latescibacter sp.]|nr:riboflavin synthase [Candidatus Latescibacter sp.]